MSPVFPKLKSGFIEKFSEAKALYSAEIGSIDREGADVFYFNILTPYGLEEELKRDLRLFGKGHLFVPTIDEQFVKKEIERLLSRISGETWDEVATKIARFSNWEFEDYKPFEAYNG